MLLKMTPPLGSQFYIERNTLKYDQTQQKWSMGSPLPKLFKGSDWLQK